MREGGVCWLPSLQFSPDWGVEDRKTHCKGGQKRWRVVVLRSQVSLWLSILGRIKKQDCRYASAHLFFFLSFPCPSRHPVVRKWPRSYEWFFMKMNIEHIWLQSWYGEVSAIAVEEYLKAVPSKGWLSGLRGRDLLSFLSKHFQNFMLNGYFTVIFFFSPKGFQIALSYMELSENKPTQTFKL